MDTLVWPSLACPRAHGGLTQVLGAFGGSLHWGGLGTNPNGMPGTLEVPGITVVFTVWNEAYIMLVSCIDYALDMTCIQSVSQCFIVCGIL